MKERARKSKIGIKFLYIWKKIRDSRIRTKLYVFLFFIVILAAGVIGGVSYVSMRESLIENTEDSLISLLKYAGGQLDENMREFQTSVYSLSTDQEIRELAESERSENSWVHTVAEQGMADRLYQYNDLYNYVNFLIMETKSGEIYIYNSADSSEKMDQEAAEKLLEECGDEVSVASPAAWKKASGHTCLILEITRQENNRAAESLGKMIFALKPSFFELGDDSNPYFTDDNIIVADRDGEVYRDQGLGIRGLDIEELISHRDGSYYVYSRQMQADGEDYLVIPLRTERFRMNLICVVPESMILERANAVVMTVALVSLLLLAAGSVIAGLIYRMIRRNLDLIEEGMKNYEVGDYSRLSSPACYDELGMLILQFNHMGMEINRLNDLAIQEEEEKQNLRYQVLETQINPHFLYNTLGTLKWMAYEREEEDIAKLAGALINLLRFTVKNVNKTISLSQEIAYIRDYITIQKTRYEDVFDVEYQVSEEAAQFPVICFILQPFVENSILHGLDIARADGKIRITGEVKREENRLYLSVEDNGAGMTPEKIKELEDKIENNKPEEYKGFNGLGVTNIILRLRTVYGSRFEYRIESTEGAGTKIMLIIPGEVENK